MEPPPNWPFAERDSSLKRHSPDTLSATPGDSKPTWHPNANRKLLTSSVQLHWTHSHIYQHCGPHIRSGLLSFAEWSTCSGILSRRRPSSLDVERMGCCLLHPHDWDQKAQLGARDRRISEKPEKEDKEGRETNQCKHVSHTHINKPECFASFSSRSKGA